MRKMWLLALIVAAAQPGLVGRARPDVGLVKIDAIVTDARGRVVTDLRPTDFEIVEDGTAREIDSVRFVSAGAAPGELLPPILSSEDERSESAREGTRLFALFLDEYHVGAGQPVERARAALTQFVETRLTARDMVLVVKPLDSLVSMRLTRDRAAILRAIAGFDGRKGDFAARTDFEREYIAQDPARIAGVRAQIAASALTAIAEHLGTLQPGRKTIIAVTEGFSRPVRRRGEAALPSLDVVVRSANRAGVSIYPVDPRALVDAAAASAGVGDAEQSDLATLQALAGGTGGEAILANVPAGFERMVTDASGYYLVAFRPGSSDETGRFRPVSVRVSRPSVTLRTRPGYWEPFADPMTVLARADAMTPFVLPTHASPLIRPWFGFSRGTDGKTRVQYAWEPAASVPGERSRAGVPARTVLTAFDRHGNVLVEAVTVPAGGGVTTFELDPGTVQLSIRIEDAKASLLDTDVRQLNVSPLPGAVALGSAQVYRARTPREFRELSENPDAVPVVTRQFNRADRLLVRMPVYSTEPAVVTATLSSVRGPAMRTLEVLAGSTPQTRTIDLPLAGLASGEYRITVKASADTDHAEGELSFRVAP